MSTAQKESKAEREIHFLMSITEKTPKAEIEKAYRAFELPERSNKVNVRIFERLLGTYAKYSAEKKAARISDLKTFLIKSELAVDYETLLAKLKIVKAGVKRSNRLAQFVEI